LTEAGSAAVVEPSTIEALAAQIDGARTSGLKLSARGGGTRPSPAASRAGADRILKTTRLSRILLYEPADLTITVEAGCSMVEVQETLAAKGQFLPLQHYRRPGTAGGLVAAAPEGALELGYGAARDRLIGVKVALADGTVAMGGGRVVKNVAGYALHRLMIGSMGTLGVIVEASFKIQPLPEATGSALLDFDDPAAAFEAARLVARSGTEPVFVNVLLEGGDCRLAVGYDGGVKRVEAHLRALPASVGKTRPRGMKILDPAEAAALRARLDDPAAWTGAGNGVSAKEAPERPDPSGAARDRTDPAAGEAPPADRREATLARTPLAVNETPHADRGDRSPDVRVRPADSACFVVRIAVLPGLLEACVQRVLETANAFGVRVDVDARPALGTAFLVVGSGAGGSTRGEVERSPSMSGAEIPCSSPAPKMAVAGRRGQAGAFAETSVMLASVLSSVRAQGHAVVLAAPRGLPSVVDPWGPPSEDFFLMERIKAALDPDGVFARGAFVGGL
jgi:FAD/FMN-containing dehydrogenase